jgi:tetraacyldisaccharide 4'-kinase
MNFLRFVLYPFTALYWTITFVRNKLFDWHILSEFRCAKPVVAIGNITVGGTGKTPHVRFIANEMHNRYTCAILSRGYKRATKGYVDSLQAPSPKALGDESYMYHTSFPDMLVAVCERRVQGAQKIIRKHPHIDAILLDDAYQHRHIKPSVNILLIDYNRPLSSDTVFPFGRMREGAYAVKRADIIIFSKCPALSDEDKKTLRNSLAYRTFQAVLFSQVEYGLPYHIEHKIELTMNDALSGRSVILLTGIAQVQSMKDYVQAYALSLTHLEYADHYEYTSADVSRISSIAQSQQSSPVIITTEKDMAKLIDAGITEIDIPVYNYELFSTFFFIGD